VQARARIGGYPEIRVIASLTPMPRFKITKHGNVAVIRCGHCYSLLEVCPYAIVRFYLVKPLVSKAATVSLIPAPFDSARA